MVADRRLKRQPADRWVRQAEKCRGQTTSPQACRLPRTASPVGRTFVRCLRLSRDKSMFFPTQNCDPRRWWTLWALPRRRHPDWFFHLDGKRGKGDVTDPCLRLLRPPPRSECLLPL